MGVDWINVAHTCGWLLQRRQWDFRFYKIWGNFWTMWGTMLLNEDSAAWSYHHVVVLLLQILMIMWQQMSKTFAALHCQMRKCYLL